MEWNAIVNLIDPRLFIVVAVCWVVGFIIKQTPNVPDWCIIYIVTAVAIVFAVLLIGMTAEVIMQGILCGAVAVYGNQLIKQAKKGGEKNG